MRIKVKNLANILNLSPSTVALVLNNKPGISEVTRNRVYQAIKELGYEELIMTENVERPEDISIIGVENMSLSEMADPPLTTVQIPKHMIVLLLPIQ